MKISKEHFIESWRDWIVCKFNKEIMNKDPIFFEPHVITEEEKNNFALRCHLSSLKPSNY